MSRKETKNFPVLIIYVFISLLAIGGAIFYEVKSGSTIDNNNGIYVMGKKIVLKENEKYIIKVDEELNGKLSFECSDYGTADISSNSVIVSKKTGKAVIIIKDENNKVLKTINLQVVKESSKVKSDSNIDTIDDINNDIIIDVNDDTSNDDNNNENNNNNNDNGSNNSSNNNHKNNNHNSNGNNNNNGNNGSIEPEGLSFYNGKLYVAIQYSITVGESKNN